MMLEQDLNVFLATSFAFAIKTQKFHWNVMGSDFSAYHEFYQEVYEEVYEAVDDIAEVIRTLGEFPAGSLTEFSELSQITEQDDVITDGLEQMEILAKDNDVILRLINIGMNEAQQVGADDVEDFLVERMRAHKKHGWMINSHVMRQQRR